MLPEKNLFRFVGKALQKTGERLIKASGSNGLPPPDKNKKDCLPELYGQKQKIEDLRPVEGIVFGREKIDLEELGKDPLGVFSRLGVSDKWGGTPIILSREQVFGCSYEAGSGWLYHNWQVGLVRVAEGCLGNNNYREAIAKINPFFAQIISGKAYAGGDLLAKLKFIKLNFGDHYGHNPADPKMVKALVFFHFLLLAETEKSPLAKAKLKQECNIPIAVGLEFGKAEEKK